MLSVDVAAMDTLSHCLCGFPPTATQDDLRGFEQAHSDKLM
jgi:hypothetical protein